SMLMLGGVFAVVLGLQSLTFHGLLDRLRREAASWHEPIITPADLQFTKDTVLDHWSLTATFMFLQGRTPRQYIAGQESDWIALMAASPRVPLPPGKGYPPAPGPAGWFDHRLMLSRAPRVHP